MTRSLQIVCFVSIAASPCFAIEPNETFATSTVLSPGTLSVADELTTSSTSPDTVLGARDLFGSIAFVDDDGSPLGDGGASALFGVPTNSGAYSFAVSGFDDFDFVGVHSEAGAYEVFVDVYDFFNDLVYEFSEVRQLQPGVVHEFSDFNAAWISGSYDVTIDNTATIADIDFFTFSGLTPGAEFTARTLDPDEIEIDTYLGWFASDGSLIAENDDDGGGPSDLLSLLEGVVPADGTLTFAVTGYGDDFFEGTHGESGAYELLIELGSSVLAGDYNDDGFVDAADYVMWRDIQGGEFELENRNPALSGAVGPDDYDYWVSNFGNESGGSAFENAVAPEPTSLLLTIVGIGLGAIVMLCRRPKAR